MVFLTREAFLYRGQDTVGFYDILPSDELSIDGAVIGEAHFLDYLERFAGMDMTQARPADIDEVILYLLQYPAQEHRWLRPCADAAARGFSALLRGGEATRALRMRLVQLNFCIRNILDRAISLPTTEENILPYHWPWDFLATAEGTFWITSDEQNIVLNDRSWRLGLPTQIDVIDERRISIGSSYSNGAFVWERGAFQPLEHSKPIILSWKQGDVLWTIDSSGAILRPGHMPAMRLPVEVVSKCRRLGDQLYIFDWTQSHHLLALDLRSRELRHIALPDIFVPNDITQVGEHFYFLDKMQGHVFKYDTNFVFLEKRLGLGKEHGQLYDPIAIRTDGSKLHILNWLTNKVMSLSLF